MCIFSGPVSYVGSTHIFARFLDGKDQVIVYETSMETRAELSMVLPIPVVQPAAENALSFIDLSNYVDFFRDIEKAFAMPIRQNLKSANIAEFAAPKALEVHFVGAFEASFVPRLQDFSRLDQRFRLPEKTWDKLPQYKN